MTYTKGEFSEKHQQAIRLFESGLGYKRVATALQLKPYTVRDWARNWRFHVRANREARPEDRAKAVAMRQQGASLMEIAAEVNNPCLKGRGLKEPLLTSLNAPLSRGATLVGNI